MAREVRVTSTQVMAARRLVRRASEKGEQPSVELLKIANARKRPSGMLRELSEIELMARIAAEAIVRDPADSEAMAVHDTLQWVLGKSAFTPWAGMQDEEIKREFGLKPNDQIPHEGQRVGIKWGTADVIGTVKAVYNEAQPRVTVAIPSSDPSGQPDIVTVSLEAITIVSDEA